MPTPQVTFKTSRGDIVIEVNPEKAPLTSENFLQYARDGHYNGTLFHRVINGFMIQGGGYNADFSEKPTGAPVKNEAKNGLKNVTGAIAMARTMDPHSATAQFFINVADNGFLDYPGQDGWGYCVFGMVTAGMDVVEQIKKVDTGSRSGHQDVPKEDILIKETLVSE